MHANQLWSIWQALTLNLAVGFTQPGRVAVLSLPWFTDPGDDFFEKIRV